MTINECTCDMFDIGPRCDSCVTECELAGHPYTEHKTNGQHHMCGLILPPWWGGGA